MQARPRSQALLLNPFPTSPEEQAEKLPVPLNCGNIPEFKFLVDRAESHLRTEEIRKRKELQIQVGRCQKVWPSEIYIPSRDYASSVSYCTLPD